MQRKTEAKEDRSSADLVTAPVEIDRVESLNALAQFDYAMAYVEAAIKQPKFILERDLLYELNRLATAGIKANAGKPRQVEVTISNSKHKPPKWQDVPMLIDEVGRDQFFGS
jgi:hypothetical protein